MGCTGVIVYVVAVILTWQNQSLQAEELPILSAMDGGHHLVPMNMMKAAQPAQSLSTITERAHRAKGLFLQL